MVSNGFTPFVSEVDCIKYPLRREELPDQISALVSALYLIAMLIFFLVKLLDLWLGRNSLASSLGYRGALPLDLELALYAYIGGALGGTANGMRDILLWHSQLCAFGRRWIWKYIMAPWLGGTLGLFVFALIRGGITVFESGTLATGSPADAGPRLVLTYLGLGVLAGFGSREVSKWLYAASKRVFRTGTSIPVPNLVGKTEDAAKIIIGAIGLKLGEVKTAKPQGGAKPGTIMRQTPSPGSQVECGASVDVVIAQENGGTPSKNGEDGP
jgi:hypothetical protein